MCINNSSPLFVSVSKLQRRASREGVMNQVKLREQVVGRGAAVSLSQLVTQPPEGKPVRDCQRLTHERFVMGFFFF